MSACHLLRITLITALLAVAAPMAGAADDYPAEYRSAAPATLDRWGFEARTPYSFVAWRLEQRGVPVTNNSAWWLMIADGDIARLQRDLLPFTGGRIDQTPAVGAIARWPAPAPGSFGFSSWVTAVNPDGSVEIESYSPEVGYTTTTASPPWFIHLPVTGGITGGPGAPLPLPPPPPPVYVAPTPPPPPIVQAPRGPVVLRVFSFSRRSLVISTNLTRTRPARVVITGMGRKVTISRRILAGQRRSRIIVPPRLRQGRYVVTLRLNADAAGPELVRHARARKTA